MHLYLFVFTNSSFLLNSNKEILRNPDLCVLRYCRILRTPWFLITLNHPWKSRTTEKLLGAPLSHQKTIRCSSKSLVYRDGIDESHYQWWLARVGKLPFVRKECQLPYTDNLFLPSHTGLVCYLHSSFHKWK